MQKGEYILIKMKSGEEVIAQFIEHQHIDPNNFETKHGFVLRYPCIGKLSDISGYAFEPWIVMMTRENRANHLVPTSYIGFYLGEPDIDERAVDEYKRFLKQKGWN